MVAEFVDVAERKETFGCCGPIRGFGDSFRMAENSGVGGDKTRSPGRMLLSLLQTLNAVAGH
jgi:hypothetical protein